MALSPEWTSASVSYCGSSRESQLTSLRKKIKKHKDSLAHLSAERLIRLGEKSTMEKVVDKMMQADTAATVKVMPTAYYIAKNDHSYSDHLGLIELQMLNGAELGLRSRFSAVNIIDHISHKMRLKACSQIQKIKGKISVLIDKSTTLSNISTLILYLKCETSKSDDPLFLFLDLVEIEDQSAATITSRVIQCLNKTRFAEKYLKKNLVAFACDGASAMLGKKSVSLSLLLKCILILLVGIV